MSLFSRAVEGQPLRIPAAAYNAAMEAAEEFARKGRPTGGAGIPGQTFANSIVATVKNTLSVNIAAGQLFYLEEQQAEPLLSKDEDNLYPLGFNSVFWYRTAAAPTTTIEHARIQSLPLAVATEFIEADSIGKCCVYGPVVVLNTFETSGYDYLNCRYVDLSTRAASSSGTPTSYLPGSAVRSQFNTGIRIITTLPRPSLSPSSLYSLVWLENTSPMFSSYLSRAYGAFSSLIGQDFFALTSAGAFPDLTYHTVHPSVSGTYFNKLSMIRLPHAGHWDIDLRVHSENLTGTVSSIPVGEVGYLTAKVSLWRINDDGTVHSNLIPNTPFAEHTQSSLTAIFQYGIGSYSVRSRFAIIDYDPDPVDDPDGLTLCVGIRVDARNGTGSNIQLTGYGSITAELARPRRAMVIPTLA